MTPHDGPRSPAASRRTRRAGALAAGALAAGLVAGAAPSASAHDRLVSSDPESGAVLASAPQEAVLTFSSEVQELGTVVEVQDDAGEPAGGGEASVEGRDVVLALPPDLEGGDYALVYRVTSSDGHPISGEVPFTLEAAAAPSAQPSASATPSTSPSATAGPSPSASEAPPSATAGDGAQDAEPAASSSDADVPWAPVVVVLVVVVLGGLAAVVLGRRRGPRTR